MKQSFLLTASLLLAFICTSSFAQNKDMTAGSPYKATYSSKFMIGKSAYAQKILDLWKDWDDNNLDRHADYMADSLVMFLPDSSVVRGKKENLEGAKKYRSGFSKVTSILHAWVPLTSTDKNEDVVCVWGQETDTYPDGKVETRDIHEVWWFNKAGKITAMRQWTAKFGNPGN